MPTLSVPAAQLDEPRTWTSQFAVDPLAPYGRPVTVEYQSTIPASIADWNPALPAGLAADVTEAEAALATFDQYAFRVLGADSPALGPMSSILLRTESASSSQIEHLTAGADDLALAELDDAGSDDTRGRNARMVVANVRAMEAALRLADRLDADAICQMHSELMEEQPQLWNWAGRYRRSLVWIGRSARDGGNPANAAHVAPQPELIGDAMEDLAAFLRRSDLPVVAQAAAAHAQFETIHPFVDGNGRTGRALVHAILRGKGVLRSTTAPISAGLLRDTEGYFAALTAFRAGDAGPIVDAFARASLYAVRSGARLVDDLAGHVRTAERNLSGLRSDAAAWRVLPRLVSNPILNAPLLTKKLGMNDMAAQRALGQLVDAGVLVERTGKKRNRIYAHPGILATLDEYSANLRRS